MLDDTPILARCKGGEALTDLPTAHGIYVLRNLVNGHFYVGSTVNLRQRCHQHFGSLRNNYHHNPHLQNAWRKYGESSFVFLVIEIIPSQSDILPREQAWIDRLNASGRSDCYNFCEKAGSHLGRKRSEETRRKLSEANTGKHHSDESKQKMRAAKLGRKLSEDHKRKVAETSRGRPGPQHSEEQNWKWRKLTPEQIAEFRKLRAEGWSGHRLARHFGINPSTACEIINGESYRGAE